MMYLRNEDNIRERIEKKYSLQKNNPKGVNQHTKVHIMTKKKTDDELKEIIRTNHKIAEEYSNQAKSLIAKAIHYRKLREDAIRELVGGME